VTEVRDSLRRWFVYFYIATSVAAAALHHYRRVQRRRRAWRQVRAGW